MTIHGKVRDGVLTFDSAVEWLKALAPHEGKEVEVEVREKGDSPESAELLTALCRVMGYGDTAGYEDKPRWPPHAIHEPYIDDPDGCAFCAADAVINEARKASREPPSEAKP